MKSREELSLVVIDVSTTCVEVILMQGLKMTDRSGLYSPEKNCSWF